jgi:hypothetical protein
MGVDVLVSAAPAPWRRAGVILHPLPPGDIDILRRRSAAVPDHVIHAIGICTANNDLDDADAHIRSLLDDAIIDGLANGTGCTVVHLDRAWLIGGGMDDEDGGIWNERITALALSGITELALDVGPDEPAPSVVRARELVASPSAWPQARVYLHDLLAELGADPAHVAPVLDNAVALGTEHTDALVDLVALTIRSETVCRLA